MHDNATIVDNVKLCIFVIIRNLDISSFKNSEVLGSEKSSDQNLCLFPLCL